MVVGLCVDGKKEAARRVGAGRYIYVSRRRLLYLDAAEVAVTLKVDGLGTVGGLSGTVAVDTGEGGIDAVLDADAFREANLDAAEATVDADDGTVVQVGIAQVEARKAEADVYVGTLERLAVVAVFLLAEGYVDLVKLAAVEDDGDDRLVGIAVDASPFIVEEDEFDTPHYGYEAEHILPDVVPGDDAACG